MNDAWRKLLISTLICLIVSFAIVFVVSIFEFTLDVVIAEFQLRWIVARAWSQFLLFVPVAQAWAVLITFSLAIPMQSARLTGTSFEKFGSSIVVLLVAASLFAVVFGVFHPRAISERLSIEYDSRTVRALVSAHERSFEEQNFARAVVELQQYEEIVGESDTTADLMTRYRRAAEQDESRLLADQPSGESDAVEPGTIQDFVDRASAALRSEDYSSAHYLATIARALDETNEEAARIAAEALQRLRDVAPDEEETAEATLYRSILAAKAAYDDGRTVEAYYRFRDLNDANPGNADITRYLAEVRQAVRELAVFSDELPAVLTTAGTGSFSFVNGRSAEFTEIVSIGKLVGLRAGVYAHQVELFRFDSAGRRLLHVRSDFGKIRDDSMILTISDREGPAGEIRPMVIHGQTEIDGVITLGPSADELWLLGVAFSDPEGATIPELIRTSRTADQYGLVPEPVQAELLHRLSVPFQFLVLSIITLGFAWRYRSRYLASPPVITYLLLAGAPLVLVPAYLLIEFGHRLLHSSLLLWSGPTPALIILLALEAVLLAFSLTYVALSARE